MSFNSLAQNITTLKNTKDGIKNALSSLGVDLVGKSFTDYPEIISGLSTGGGGCWNA